MFHSRTVHVHKYAPMCLWVTWAWSSWAYPTRACFYRSSGAALAFCSGLKAPEHQSDGDHKAADAVADVSLEAVAAKMHEQSGKQPSGVHDSQQTQQLGAATDKPAFIFSKASKAEATQALASVGLTNDLVQALVENFTTDQLQACLENAQQVERMENSTGAALPTSETQPGAMQADPTPPAPAAELSTRHHHAGALPDTASQTPAQAAAQAADDKTGSSSLLDVMRAADTSDARDAAPQAASLASLVSAAPQAGVLLVSGSHVRHWVAATNLVGYLQVTPPPPPLNLHPPPLSCTGCASPQSKAIL